MNNIFKIVFCVSLTFLGTTPSLGDEFCDSLKAIAATAPNQFQSALSKKLGIYRFDEAVPRTTGCIIFGRDSSTMYVCFLGPLSHPRFENFASRIAACAGTPVPPRDYSAPFGRQYSFQLNGMGLALAVLDMSDGPGPGPMALEFFVPAKTINQKKAVTDN